MAADEDKTNFILRVKYCTIVLRDLPIAQWAILTIFGSSKNPVFLYEQILSHIKVDFKNFGAKFMTFLKNFSCPFELEKLFFELPNL